jgi:hypothetical protein
VIVISPTGAWIQAALQDCERSLIISSPYVGGYLRDKVAVLPESVSVTLLTRTLLTDFASNASDLEAVREIAQRSGGVLSLSSLHAKVYIVDDTRALVTSANATFSGMYRNRECGIEVTVPSEVQNLSELLVSGFGAIPRPQRWSVSDLEELREPVKALQAVVPRIPKLPEGAIEAPTRVKLQQRQFHRLLNTLPGWTQLTLEGVSRIESDVFTMEQVWNACAPLAAERFPNNQHVREKLRQQMQRLRDLGLVIFFGKGQYERLTQLR